MALIQVSELAPARQEEAFGLVRLGSSHSEVEWLHCLHPLASGGRGVLSAAAINGVLLGVAAYEVQDDGPLGRVLGVPLFVAFELGGKGTTGAALRGGLEQVAGQLGCGAVRFVGASRGLVQGGVAAAQE